MEMWNAVKKNISRQIAEKWPHMVIFSVCVMCMGVMRWDSVVEQVQAHEMRLDRLDNDHDLLVSTAQEVHDIHSALGLTVHRKY